MGKEKKVIWVISGGGCRGAIAAKSLEKFGNECGKPDLIIGTSVGSILGAWVSKNGGNVEGTKKIFKECAKQMFGKKDNITPPIYDLKRAKICLDKDGILGGRMGDLKIPLIISTVDFVRTQTLYRNSDGASVDKKQKIVDFITPSFAAPVYFTHIDFPREELILSDGGVGNNNFPIMPAFIEAVKRGWGAEELEICAFGTGTKKLTPKEITSRYNRLSKKKWLGAVANTILFARKSAQEEQLNAGINLAEKLPNVKFKYYDADLNKEYDLDDWKSIDEMFELPIFEEIYG